MKLQDWQHKLEQDEFSKILALLYGPCEEQRIEEERARYASLLSAFESFFDVPSDADTFLFSTPGRSEISGNHTDHQQGRVLACSVNLDIIAAARLIDDPVIRIKSHEFTKMDEIEIDDLNPHENEREHSAALIRGIAHKLDEAGYELGGCEVYTMSKVPKGSGLSSSAAFEVLVATVLDHLFGDGKLLPLERAKISQYAENVYFGKPSGLMDQSACSVGGLITLDFKDPQEPDLRALGVDFSDFGYDLVITQCPGDHADLTNEYAAIPEEMRSVASAFGQEVLRGISLEDLEQKLPELHNKVSDRAILRTYHFITENERVPKLVKALEDGNLKEFFQGIRESGESSWMYLQNLYAPKEPEVQSLGLGLMLSEMLLHDDGAWRVHGGGFAGTIQAFVPHEKSAEYQQQMDQLFGEGSCQILNIRPVGSVCIDRL